MFKKLKDPLTVSYTEEKLEEIADAMTDEVWDLINHSIKSDNEDEDKKFITLEEFLLWFHHKNCPDFLDLLKKLKEQNQQVIGQK